jgi:C-terminal, D2-small domain, of ClpB protein/AAA domain (Cdc48 subfamily)
MSLMLQILDDGRLTDSKGRLIDFTNTLIVMTTNLGSKIIERESGIKAKTQQEGSGLKLTTNEGIFGWEPAQEVVQDSKVRDKVKKLVDDELKNFFRPEFLNRIDEIIVFSHLTRRDLWEICELMVKSLVNRLKDKEINLIVRKPVQALLTDEGYDPLYGARPLRRAIMHYLEDDLAEKCLSQTLYPNTKIIVDRKTLEQKRKEEKLMVGSTQQEMTQSKANLFDDLDTSFSDYRESETYTNELKIEIDFSEVDPKLLNGEAEENEKTLELEENNKVTIEGFSTIAEKLRGLLISSSSEDQESNELNEENDSNENIEKESETETKKSENKKSSESTESESSSEDKPKRNRFGLLKRIAAAIFGKIPRFR